MANTSGAPSGATATDTSGQLPDCIIASSCRHNDLLPFCNNIYFAEPQKWGCILPWEFPQDAPKEVEDEFLRKYFSETDIHMQGGAHGVGAGFRFLKHAWYSIALWNYEKRVPSIATWWLESKENASVLEDPTMRDTLCNAEVTPETCFDSRDIQTYGKTLLGCVVKHIQDQVKARQTPPVEKLPTTDVVRSASDSNVALDLAKTKPLLVAASPTVSNNRQIGDAVYSRPPRATSASVPTDNPAPFPIYDENARSEQHVPKSEHVHSAWNYGHPNQSIEGRKRGGRLSSTGGGARGRGASYDRPTQEHQHRFNSSMISPNNALVDSPTSFAAQLPATVTYPGQMPVAYSNVPLPTGMPSALAYDNSGVRTPRQRVHDPYFPPGEFHSQSSIAPDMFVGGPTNKGQFTHHHDTERLPSDRPPNSGFNNISARSGDVRRSSFGSRGGLRGFNQHRGGGRGGRGGRGRDPGSQVGQVYEEGSYARKASNEPYCKPNFNYGNRRKSAYQENTWRSGSEHPQVENTLPQQRVLSGPNEYPGYQGGPNVTGAHLLPPFTFPHNHSGERHAHVELRPPPGGFTRHQHVFPDLEVYEKYIGADATHVNELVFSNVPCQLTEDDVARDIGRACDVKVAKVHFNSKPHNGPEYPTRRAFVELPNHNVARRVLDLREVILYGKPLYVRVPHKFLTQTMMPPISGQHGYSLNASGGSFVSSGQFIPASYGYPHESAPPPQFGLAAMGANRSGYPGEVPRPGFVDCSPTTPFHSGKGEPALATVLSSNATPANSEPNTPKKQKKKGKKKVVTSCAKIVEDQSSVSMDTTSSKMAHETLSQTGRNKQDQDGSNGLLASEEVTSSSNKPVSKDSKALENMTDSKDSKVPKGGKTVKELRPSLDLSVEISQAAEETKTDSESLQIHERTLDVSPTVSPRSQVPNHVLDRGDLVLYNIKQAQEGFSDKEPDVLHPTSPVSGKDRPGIVDRISDSEHIDESFHTANASPPTDKQSQSRLVSISHKTPPSNTRSKDSATASDNRSTSSQSKDVVAVTDEHISTAKVDVAARHDSTSNNHVSLRKKEPGSPQRTPKTPLPISVEEPTPPGKQPASTLRESKPSRSTSSRSVSDPLSAQQVSSFTEVSEQQVKVKKSPRVATEHLKDSNPENNIPSRENDKRSGDDQSQTLAAQHVTSATSIPPTPMTAYHTAPTTPASLQTSTSEHSAEKSSGQSRLPAKKGPSQTESLSMFGKKQQKQKKPAKGKGTLKGKPLESGNGSSLTSGSASQDMSGTATPLSATTPTSSKKPALNVKTGTTSDVPAPSTGKPKAGAKSGEIVSSEGNTGAVSGQASPNKGGLRNLFGLFGRVKSPSVSGKETSLENVPPEDELTDSKAPVATSQTLFNIDHLLQQSTFDDERTHGDSSVFNTHVNIDFNDSVEFDDISGMPAIGLGISASNSADPKETPKKKRKKKKSKSAKQSESRRESSPDARGQGEKAVSISTSSVQTGDVSVSYDAESDDRSEKSSTTMGRPTPPVSPVPLTPGKKRLIEQRMVEEHIVSPRAPRNKHVKKKSYSRVASSATQSSAQESSPPTIAATPTPASETEIDQQRRLLQLFHLDGDGNAASPDHATIPQTLVLPDLVDDEGNPQQVILTLIRILKLNDGRSMNIYRLGSKGSGSDADSDDVALAIERVESMEEGLATERKVTEDGSTGGRGQEK